jgi:hypothetical protein
MNLVFMQDFASRDLRSVHRNLRTDASESGNDSTNKAATPHKLICHKSAMAVLKELTCGIRNGLRLAGLISIGLLLGASLLQLICHS